MSGHTEIPIRACGHNLRLLKGQEGIWIYFNRRTREGTTELYIKYCKCAANVSHELGYADRKTLRNWYEAYLEEQETKIAVNLGWRCKKYWGEQMVTAVEHYLQHNRNLSRIIRALGYPLSRSALRFWWNQLALGSRKIYIGRKVRLRAEARSSNCAMHYGQ